MVKATARVQRRRIIDCVGQGGLGRNVHHRRREIVPKIYEKNQVNGKEHIQRQRKINPKHNVDLRCAVNFRRLAITRGQALEVSEEQQEINVGEARSSNPLSDEGVVQTDCTHQVDRRRHRTNDGGCDEEDNHCIQEGRRLIFVHCAKVTHKHRHKRCKQCAAARV